jgi:hypothetical protein
MRFWNLSGTAITWRACRLRWPRSSTWRAAVRSTKKRGHPGRHPESPPADRQLSRDGTALSAVDGSHPCRAGEGTPHCPPVVTERDRARPVRSLSAGTGVNPDSKVPTFAALHLFVDSWRWKGVPFLVRAGKCLETTRHGGDCRAQSSRRAWCSTSRRRRMETTVRFRLSPDVAIAYRRAREASWRVHARRAPGASRG